MGTRKAHAASATGTLAYPPVTKRTSGRRRRPNRSAVKTPSASLTRLRAARQGASPCSPPAGIPAKGSPARAASRSSTLP
jgi:hypothetical protein